MEIGVEAQCRTSRVVLATHECKISYLPIRAKAGTGVQRSRVASSALPAASIGTRRAQGCSWGEVTIAVKRVQSTTEAILRKGLKHFSLALDMGIKYSRGIRYKRYQTGY